VRMTEHLQRLALKWMVWTRDGHAFGEVLMVGSVWWCPSIESITTN
jgi:hypothetical protein